MNGRRNYFMVKSPRKYGNRPGTNSQHLDLQSDTYLQSDTVDTLPSALQGPLKRTIIKDECSSRVSKVNTLFILGENLVSGYPKDPYILGPPFLKLFGLLKRTFRFFKDFIFTFFMQKFYLKKWLVTLKR